MTVDPEANFLELPDNLPMPVDDGLALHLRGLSIPAVHLPSTSGETLALDRLPKRSVIFIYPMTGVPGVALPEGWDDIPGARGCTPQACAYRDAYEEILHHADSVFGLSTQSTQYQSEFRNRVKLPYHLLSDFDEQARVALDLPTFKLHDSTYLKRLTLIIESGVIVSVHYPVFPSNQDANWVLETLKNLSWD